MEIIDTLKERDREIQGQWQYNKIINSRFCKRYKYIYEARVPRYLEERGEGDSQSLMARVRCGNIEEGNKYWRKEEERRCMMCERYRGTLKHLVEDCDQMERTGLNIEKIVQNRRVRETIDWLRSVEAKRKEISKRKEGEAIIVDIR